MILLGEFIYTLSIFQQHKQDN